MNPTYESKGVIDKKTDEQSVYFDTPFSYPINFDRVVRYQEKKKFSRNAKTQPLLLVSTILSFLSFILILVLATIGIIINPENMNPYQVIILLLDFCIISFFTSITMEFIKIKKMR
jgi:O-antigen/teichoic acid export membrane protein